MCSYSSDRKYNLDRHNDKRHSDKNADDSLIDDKSNTNSKIKLFCQKCYKEYASTRRLKEHESKCDGIDCLTCSKCMKTFAHAQSKYNHMKSNKCEARSKVFYKNPNFEKKNEIINSNNKNTTINSHNTTNNTNNTNNIYNITINDFGKERTDHITIDKLMTILRSNNIIPEYIDAKHFNINFPENHNIKYEKNICYIKSKDNWQPIGIDRLSSTLLKNNTYEIARKYNESKDIIQNFIQNIDIIEYIEKKFDYLDLMTNKIKYKETLHDIKNIIKTSKL
jgi:hypothetical protein